MVVVLDGLLDAGHRDHAFAADHADGAEIIERELPSARIDPRQAQFQPAYVAAIGYAVRDQRRPPARSHLLGLGDRPLQVDHLAESRRLPRNQRRKLLDRPRLRHHVQEDAPAAVLPRAEDKRHMMDFAAGVDPSVVGFGRDGHRVAFVDVRPMRAQHGLPVRRIETQMDLDAEVVPVDGHVLLVAGQIGQVPGVMVAVDQRHDGDAEVRHDEARLDRAPRRRGSDGCRCRP